MSAGTLDVVFLAAAILGVLGSLYFYVVGVLTRDRLLSRVAAVTAVALGVAAAVYWWRTF